MFLKVTRQGHTWREGPFLILFDNGATKDLRALVRRVRLSQCGHFMMGRVEVAGFKIGLSGGYGGDGLSIGVFDMLDNAPRWPGLWEKLHPVPQDLREAYRVGGGWNAPGAEALEFHAWATKNQKVLTRLRKGEDG
jgi:hypothetical protein